MNKSILVAVAVAILAAPWAAWADPAQPLGALAKMPVKEVTVFKDGHAYVIHQGRMATDARGNVVLDYLPAPVLGTFWPFSADKAAKLTAVTAGQRKVQIDRTALALRDLIEANVGAAAVITEAPHAGATVPPEPYEATIVSVPVQSGEELEAISPPNTGEKLPVRGELVLLKTARGVKAVPLARIQAVTFKDPPKSKLAHEEFRNLLTLKFAWQGQAAAKVDVGLMYVQRGIRWIPNYKVTLDGQGQAKVQLQATLINELTDLEDVTCNLVIGVPTFAFKDTVDPMSLQATVARLSQYFQEDQVGSQMLSNAIMTQTARMGEYRGRRPQPDQPPPLDLGPEVGGAEKAEDLYVFSVNHVSLRKGQRMVVPVAEFTLPYRDVFTLDMPFVPPPEVYRNFNTQQQAEIARLLAAPKVMHVIRLTNKSKYPLTTAPALIIRGDRVLAQGMMTYTSVGSETDLEVTAAVDVRVKKTDTETMRTPNAHVWDGHQYARVALAGTIKLTNYRDVPVELEVVRNVLGNVTEATHDGKVEMVNVIEDEAYGRSYSHPHWWGWYNWPYWWRHFNGVGRVTWKLTLEPTKSAELGYTWHYFWR
ncbi:MAG: hypothetical protein BWX88_04250 [Planctomycetes bacterium ADurb.Bin126]|nr:MAG: hypothetical protein BWX88_04250 [Planctomycetes bacterium ADurb.Bin126]HOD83557.1 hypothetical protein [Phycisphaerae bacterium]HQL74740.1 hypothetical protein [Phycisphaerae bacterium]